MAAWFGAGSGGTDAGARVAGDTGLAPEAGAPRQAVAVTEPQTSAVVIRIAYAPRRDERSKEIRLIDLSQGVIFRA
ncbi:MAG TPA: hypothetical protein VM736_11480 [Gemmatimonadales bacterium]|nr:hypothetical protein [Gemmatimonadales bacterium]